MISYDQTPDQTRVLSMVELRATELFMESGFRIGNLVRLGDNTTGRALEDASHTLGEELFRVIAPNALDPDGIDQRELEELQIGFKEQDIKPVYLPYKPSFRIYNREPDIPLRYTALHEKITVRLGRKALGQALSALYEARHNQN